MQLNDLVIEAQRAKEKGYVDRAVSYFLECERLEPANPAWPREAADCYKALGNIKEYVEALNRVARRYAAQGLVLKAVVALKAALAADPHHDPSRRALEKLQLATQKNAPPPAAPKRMVVGIPAEPSKLAVIPLVRAQIKRELPPPATTAVAFANVRELSFEDFEAKEAPLPASGDAAPMSMRGGPAPALAGQGDDEFEIDVLPPIPLFSSLDSKSFQALMDKSRVLELVDGQFVFKQGDRGDALYVITEGAVTISLEGPPRRKVAELKEGEFFGEIAMLCGRPRSASVQAQGNTVLIEMSQRNILEIVRQDPSILAVLMSFLRDRLASLVLRDHAIFKQLSDADRARLAHHFHVFDVAEDTTMVRQDVPSEGLFVLVDGSASVVREDAGGKSLVALLDPGHVFGEISLMTGKPAVANVVAQERCVVLKLPHTSFQQAMSELPELRRIASGLAVQRLKDLGETGSTPPPPLGKTELV